MSMTVGMLMQLLVNYPIDKEVFIEYPHEVADDEEWNCVPVDGVGSGNYNRLVIGSLAMTSKLYLEKCLNKLRLENKEMDAKYNYEQESRETHFV